MQIELISFTHFSNSVNPLPKINEKRAAQKRKSVGNITLKRLPPTRWSSRHDALYALLLRYTCVLKALSKIVLTSLNKDEIKEAKVIKSKLENLKIVFLIVLETKVLNATDAISKILQSKHEDIQNAIKMLSALFNNLKGFRDIRILKMKLLI
ncbi:unnamed protein product [Psylliodes chrysocephalus]|uniref:Uncharacterized protein n=1 Tax=Psylliodes chrysocephalus TaxID=3402493 RepID=A0A9P0D4N7_9CUCU|nr:unnamed protein product [Psylliodes chrysocephala]